MHALIWHFARILPTWLLLETDWASTKQAAPLNNEISNAVAELTRRAAAKRVTVGDYIDELLYEHRHEVEKSKQCYEALPPAKRRRFAELLVLRKAEGLEGLDGLLQACHPTIFASTGDYYQMTLPKKLDVDCVKQAHLKLAGTVDDEYLVHSERLLTAIPYARAVELRKSLHAMDLNARLADRRALLFED
jgi:hypothetical protein